MIFNEIVLEGVRCFKALRRIPMKPGFNLVYGPNETGKSTLNECIFLLLDPLRKVGEEEEYPSWGPPGNSRAGLILQEGQDVYRLTRDFVNGQVTFSQLNPQTKKFEAPIHDPGQIDATLKQKFNLPPISMYRKLFSFCREDLPSGRSRVIVKKITVPPPSGGDPLGAPGGFGTPGQAAPVQPPPGYGLSVEEKKKRIEELKAARDQAKQAAETQFEIDGLENKRYEIENKMKTISSLEDQQSQLQQGLDKLSSFQELPPDIIKRIKDFEGTQREQNKEITALDNKISQAQGQHQTFNLRTPFFKEQLFMIGAACAVASIVLHILKLQLPLMKVFPPLLFMAGVVLVFWIAFQEISARGNENKAKSELDKFAGERRESEKKFEVENSVIKRLMEQANVDDPKELEDKLKEFTAITERFNELDERILKGKKEVGYNDLEREHEQYQGRIEELNKQMRESGETGFSEDPADIQRQIDALQYSIDHPDAPASPPTAPSGPGSDFGGPTFSGGSGGSGDDGFLGGGGGDDDFLAGADTGSGSDFGGGFDIPAPGGDKTMMSDPEESVEEMESNPVDELWMQAETFTGMDRSTLIMQVQDTFNVYVQAFTNKVYAEGDLSSEKTVSLRNASGGYTDLGKLSPSSQDAAWLALKLAIIGNLIKKANLPVLMDDPLRFLDDIRLAMVSRTLKKIGAQTQIVLLSTQKAHGKIADHAISLVPQNANK